MKRFKKKGFVVDKISEDTFYENLLLGLDTLLKGCEFITQTQLQPYAPATVSEIFHWQHCNNMILPEDLCNFYLSTNGFSFTYTFSYDKAENAAVVGSIEIHPLSHLEKIATSDNTYLTETGSKVLAPNSKLFVLSKMDDESCVVLAQFTPTKSPNIWLFYKTRIFYLLCDDFTSYFCMALAHLGVPCWQLAVLNAKLPEWSAELIQILAPGVGLKQFVSDDSVVNVIDPGIFGLVGCEGAKGSRVGSVCKKKSKSARNKTK